LATTLSEEGHLAEAEELQREVLEQQKRARGPEAYFTLVSMNNLASVCRFGGQGQGARCFAKIRLTGPALKPFTTTCLHRSPIPTRINQAAKKRLPSLKIIQNHTASPDFDNGTYYGLNAFCSIDAAGKSTPARWTLMPVQPFARAARKATRTTFSMH
jgi:hypothetical protein